jgi:hypothetical protein
LLRNTLKGGKFSGDSRKALEMCTNLTTAEANFRRVGLAGAHVIPVIARQARELLAEALAHREGELVD